jgi:hypothetical protein
VFQNYRRELAGPIIPFDAEVALSATELVRYACWFVISRSESADEVDKLLKMPHLPMMPAHHLSADLLFRYLPLVHRRARALHAGDILPKILEKSLREWPLSGVLADIPDGPFAPLDFHGIAGLWMFYAERLARHDKPAWQPADEGREYIELVRHEAADRGR